MNRGVLTGLGPGDAPDVLSGDAGQNALLVAGNRKELKYSAATATVVVDVGDYRWMSVQHISGTQNLIGCSNDGVNFVTMPLLVMSATPSGGSGNITSAGIYTGPIAGRFIQLSMTSWTGTIEFFATPQKTSGIDPVQIQNSLLAVSGGGQNFADGQSNAISPPVWTYPMAYNGSTWDRPRTPNTFKTATATASGDTAVWTPTAGKKFRLMRYRIEVTGDAATSGGAEIDIVLRDATTATSHACSLYVPAAGGTLLGGYTTGWVDVGNGQLSSAANAVLNVNLSAALSAGKVRVVACGTEE